MSDYVPAMSTNTASKQENNQNKQTLGFQAEVKQVLKLVINSLYSNKEIFLRELISNASDACDKLRFEGIANDKLFEKDPDLKIEVRLDKKARTITITDNGIGMSRDEVVTNIGTIAKSGTREFLDQLTGDKQKDLNLIGQFGVGFYSSFIVAESVELKTRRAGAEADAGVAWQSKGEGEYTLVVLNRETRGTEVVVHLKAGEDDFLEDYRVEEIIRKFSDHISLPVFLISSDDKGKEERRQVNKASALWTRPKAQIKPEEYEEFYKTVSHDFGKPLTTLHARLEGNLQYTLLLFIPERAPLDLWASEHQVGIKLYVKRVFIMDDAEKLLPKYLRFVRGVVDSDDLPLNVSRELLQENQIITTIRSTAVKKVLDLLEDMAKNDKEKFAAFWKEFGRVIKEGIVEDFVNRDKIAELCRFASTFDDKAEQAVSFDDYLFRLKKGQDSIFYLIADNFIAAKNSPLLEVFRKKGIEVLLLSDRVDHWFVSHLSEFKGKKLVSISKGDVDLSFAEDEKKDDSAKSETKPADGAHKTLLDNLTKALTGKVKEVRVSKRLVNSPSCIVAGQNDLDPSLKRIFEQMGQKGPEDHPVLEINPDHALIKKIALETNDKILSDWAQVLLDQAVLAEGGQLDDPAGFVRRVNELIMSK